MNKLESVSNTTDKARYIIANDLCNRICTQTAGEIFTAVTPQKERFKLAGFHAPAKPFSLCLYVFLNEASKHLFAHCSYNFSILLRSAEEQQNNIQESSGHRMSENTRGLPHTRQSAAKNSNKLWARETETPQSLNSEREDLHVTFSCSSLDRQIKNLQRKLETAWTYVWGKIASELVKPN